jgi:hypothetical protein
MKAAISHNFHSLFEFRSIIDENNIYFFYRYCIREKPSDLFEHPESVGQLKSLLNRNTVTIHHRPLPSKNVDNQNIFFCRYVYDYRAKRILKNPSLNNPNTNPTTTITTTTTNSTTTTTTMNPITTISVPTAARM